MHPIKIQFRKSTPRSVFDAIRRQYDKYVVITEADSELVEFEKTDLYAEIKDGMTPGESLRILRRATGRTLKAVGELIGCTPQRINEYESGRRSISKAVARKMAGVFGVSAAVFI